MTPADLLFDLARHLGIAPPGLDAHGACALRFADDLTLELQFAPAQGELRLAASLGEADADELQGILIGALLANLAQSELGRPHFGYHPQARALALCLVLPIDTLDAAALAAALDRLADAGRVARGQLAGERLVH